MFKRVLILLAFAAVLALPFLVRSLAVAQSGGGPADDAPVFTATSRLVIVTPHVEQIQQEFASAFDRWHARLYGERVKIDWRAPGGTSEIIKALEASFEAAARRGLVGDNGAFPPGSAPYDLFMGGGSFEQGRMKETKTVNIGGRRVSYRMGQPMGFGKGQLREWFGGNEVGSQSLYDPDQYWLGTALAGFGIVYNRDVLKDLGLPEPRSFGDLTDFKYFNMLALTDGQLSGSVTTTYDSILNKEGWKDGWRMLRELAANARYFASAAPRPPIDVSQGEAAAGLAIDFYGRTQGQYLLKPGQPAEEGRMGYVDPEGAVYIDSDPISMLNGAANPDLARRFVEFCLTEEAQALWQFPSRDDPRSADNPLGPGGRAMGPERYELRRMPVRRIMYAKYASHMIDRTDPFKAASNMKQRGWRSAVGPLMAAFGIDTAPQLRRAWAALNRARRAADQGKFSFQTLEEMERLFYAMPEHRLRAGTLLEPGSILDGLSKSAREELAKLTITTYGMLEEQLPGLKEAGKVPPDLIAEWEDLLAKKPPPARERVALEFNDANFKTIRADTDSWRDPVHGRESLIAYTSFFRGNYERVVELGAEAGK